MIMRVGHCNSNPEKTPRLPRDRLWKDRRNECKGSYDEWREQRSRSSGSGKS